MKDFNDIYIQEISEMNFDSHSGLIFVHMDEVQKDIDSAKKRLHDLKNQSWGILQPEVEQMKSEFRKLIDRFREFYSNPIENSQLTPQQVHLQISQQLCRIKRMVCVLDPEFTPVKSFDKKSSNHYQMIRGYWINDDGERVRSISRNVGNSESSLTDLVEKIIKINSQYKVVKDPGNILGLRIDLIVSDEKDKWLVEIKSSNGDNIIRSFVSFELWKMYKEIYDLLD